MISSNVSSGFRVKKASKSRAALGDNFPMDCCMVYFSYLCFLFECYCSWQGVIAVDTIVTFADVPPALFKMIGFDEDNPLPLGFELFDQPIACRPMFRKIFLGWHRWIRFLMMVVNLPHHKMKTMLI